MNINQILETAPQFISEKGARAIEELEKQMKLEEEYKQKYSIKLLAMRQVGGKTQDEIKAELIIDPELSKIKKAEMTATIEYKKFMLEKEKGQNKFEAAKCKGYLIKAEILNLNDTIQE